LIYFFVDNVNLPRVASIEDPIGIGIVPVTYRFPVHGRYVRAVEGSRNRIRTIRISIVVGIVSVVVEC